MSSVGCREGHSRTAGELIKAWAQTLRNRMYSWLRKTVEEYAHGNLLTHSCFSISLMLGCYPKVKTQEFFSKIIEPVSLGEVKNLHRKVFN